MELDWLWVSAACAAFYAFVFKFLRRVNGWYYDLKVRTKKYPLPPGDMGWPLLGDMLTFTTAFKSGDPDSFVNRLVSRYGKTGIYKTHLFGNPSIILCTPETCRRVLTDDDNFKIGYPKSTLQLLASGSFQSFSNAERRRLRRLTTAPIAGHAVLAKYISRIEADVMSSLEEWANISMKHPLELIKELTRVTFKTIIHIFMGIHHNDQILMRIEHLFTHMMKGIFVSAIDVPGFAFHKALKARNKLVKILQSVVEERRRIIKDYPQEKTKDLIDTLLEVEDEKVGKLENEDIIDLLLSYLAAGHESTSHGIMWSLIYLTRNPHIMKQAKEEQERIMKARPPSQKRLNLKEIKQMVYLAKVMLYLEDGKCWFGQELFIWTQNITFTHKNIILQDGMIPRPKQGPFFPLVQEADSVLEVI
ncbi:hypothetical protein L6164_029368 [Bauhinia variegata]|uniref:Uncharacterized protein n=1 Tax=Bauhinia variegata TaxID=167791 RepID=A0ACB9L9J0_BAUVA|nr:hypothetical protein L6164_029368 [Bauhinia variegata]